MDTRDTKDHKCEQPTLEDPRWTQTAYPEDETQTTVDDHQSDHNDDFSLLSYYHRGPRGTMMNYSEVW